MIGAYAILQKYVVAYNLLDYLAALATLATYELRTLKRGSLVLGRRPRGNPTGVDQWSYNPAFT